MTVQMPFEVVAPGFEFKILYNLHTKPVFLKKIFTTQKHPTIVGGLLNVQEYANKRVFHLGTLKFDTLKSEAINS